MSEQSIESIAAEALHQRDALAAAILKTAVDIGLCNQDGVVTGPHLLMFCQDFTDMIKSMEAQLADLEAQLAAKG